jgi:hypothetical protein
MRPREGVGSSAIIVAGPGERPGAPHRPAPTFRPGFQSSEPGSVTHPHALGEG